MCAKITDISGVGPSTMDKIKEAGVEEFEDLRKATVDDFVQVGLSESKAEDILKYYDMNSISIMNGEEVEQKMKSLKRVTSGMPLLDEALDGGWREGDIGIVFGSSGEGKSQCIYQALVSAVESTGDPAVLVETEPGRFTTKRIKQLASDTETHKKIHLIDARKNLDQQYMAYEKILDNFDELSLMAIDSFNAHLRAEFTGRGELKPRSDEVAKHIDELEYLTQELHCPVLLSAQVYSAPDMYGAKDNPYGGNVMQHRCTFMIRLRPGQGDMKKLKVVNHASNPDQEFNMEISRDMVRVFED